MSGDILDSCTNLAFTARFLRSEVEEAGKVGGSSGRNSPTPVAAYGETTQARKREKWGASFQGVGPLVPLKIQRLVLRGREGKSRALQVV